MTAIKDAGPERVVAAEIRRFISQVLVSKRNVAKLLGISPSTLIRWLNGSHEPYAWTQEQVLRRIRMFDKADRDTDLYNRVANMTPRDRMEELESIVASDDDTNNG